MKHPILSLLALVLVLFGTGCSRSLPLISHAHIGHTLTAWRDTPQQQGLFSVTEREARTALERASMARTQGDSPGFSRARVNDVIHALNPDLVANGPGLGYGVLRGLQGSIDHMRFAATTEDASTSLIEHASEFTTHAQGVLGRFRLSLEIAQLVQSAEPEELKGLVEELHLSLQQGVYGTDADGNGTIERNADEVGLVQLRETLSGMIRAEKSPPYHPIGRRYLLGLVRLPNGLWAYKFDRSSAFDASGY